MSEVKTYFAKDVDIAIGNHMASGLGEDTFVSIEKSGDGTSKVVGCDGEVGRSIDPDRSYTVTLTLLQTSKTNAYLQNMYNKDQKTGDGVAALLIKDKKGGLVLSSNSAWVAKPATRTFAKALSAREWTLETGEADLNE